MGREHFTKTYHTSRKRYTFALLVAVSILLLSFAIPPPSQGANQDTANLILNWEQIAFSNRTVESVEIDPHNSSVMYAALTGYGDYVGVWKSIDAGINWTHILNASINGISVDPRNSNKVCAVGGEIYTSDSGGGSWSLRKNGAGCWGVKRDSYNADVLYAYSNWYTVYKSTTNGLN